MTNTLQKPTAPRWGPTPKSEWVSDQDERCHTARMSGTIQYIVWGTTIPQVRVRWDNGHAGFHTITTLRKGALT